MRQKKVNDILRKTREQVKIFTTILQPFIEKNDYLTLDTSDIEKDTLSDIQLASDIIAASGTYTYILMLMNDKNDKIAIISIDTAGFKYSIWKTKMLDEFLANTEKNITEMYNKLIS